jgi:hypothetical protein
MKGFSEIVCTIGFLIAGVAEAVNNFTNPGYHLFNLTNNSPQGDTVIQAGGGISLLSNLTSRRYYVLCAIISSSDVELHGKSIPLNRPSLSSSNHPTIPTLLFSINNLIPAHSSGPSLNFYPVELTRLKLALV